MLWSWWRPAYSFSIRHILCNFYRNLLVNTSAHQNKMIHRILIDHIFNLKYSVLFWLRLWGLAIICSIKDFNHQEKRRRMENSVYILVKILLFLLFHVLCFNPCITLFRTRTREVSVFNIPSSLTIQERLIVAVSNSLRN